jgi:hypothetical protein
MKLHGSFLILALTGALGAQAPAQKGKTPEAAPANASAPAAADQADDITVIKPVPYQTTLKRDPFATPSDDSSKSQGNLVEDIAVKGVVSGPDGKLLAVIVDSHGKSTVVPVGFRLRDGEIVGIDSRGVTFHQWELNTTNRSAYRTVVKTFKNEEAK